MASKPLTIPNVFASEGTGTPNNIPLLDADFSQVANYFNDGSFFSTRGVDTGAANAYVVTLPSGYVPSAYNVGMRLVFNPGNSNTGASTINVNALGTQTILTANGNALAGSEITAGYDCDLVYDGTNFRVLSLAIPQITSVRLRSFNAVGNPSFEVDQRQVFALVTNPAGGSFVIDRWFIQRAGTMAFNVQSIGSAADGIVPGTNFKISRCYLRITLTTAEPTLAATDRLAIAQLVEGSVWRELGTDVHSNSLLVRCSSPLKFGLRLQDSPGAYSLTKLCTISSANTWTLITLPSMAMWTASGTFSNTPGTLAYSLAINLCAGSTYMSPANDTWQAGNFLGATGQDNFAALAVNSTFDIGFVQHEPGPLCTTLQDKPFSVNLDECLRYYCKSYDYTAAIGSANGSSALSAVGANPVNTALPVAVRYPKQIAKLSTIAIYNLSTGASGSLWNASTGASVAISGVGGSGNGGFGWITLSATPAASGNLYQYHYTADTGW